MEAFRISRHCTLMHHHKFFQWAEEIALKTSVCARVVERFNQHVHAASKAATRSAAILCVSLLLEM